MQQLAKRMGIFMFHLYFFAFRCVGAEQYQYSLDIRDKLRLDWVLSDLRSVSRIECAHLCFKQESCSYFGYNVGVCHLLKNSVDEEDCAEDEESCSNPGMKIYKLREIKPPTTTEAITTTTTTKVITTTAKATTTTEEPTTTTTEEPTTTTTEEPTTTTTEKPTTTTEESPTSTAEQTTTTEEPTTITTTEKPLTTTQEPTTTTIEQTTTSSPTTTTTKEPTTTTQKTTTEPTTTTETPTTTGAPTTTTDDPFTCKPPEGAEADLNCPTEYMLLNALGSKSPFFGDALSPKCYDFKEIMYDDTKESIYTFFSLDGGFTIKAQCQNEYDLIIKFSLCVKDAHIPAITIYCFPIKDTDRIEKVFNATSEIWKDALVDCDDKAGFQSMFMSDAGDGIVTRVIFQCILFTVEDNAVEALAGDTKPATG